jgi:pimeloyl-ACP methyl ester carboxylesterase
MAEQSAASYCRVLARQDFGDDRWRNRRRCVVDDVEARLRRGDADLSRRHDPSFTVEGAHAYRRDVPDAQVHLLDAGHFALDEACDEVASLTRGFLASLEDAAREPIRR